MGFIPDTAWFERDGSLEPLGNDGLFFGVSGGLTKSRTKGGRPEQPDQNKITSLILRVSD